MGRLETILQLLIAQNQCNPVAETSITIAFSVYIIVYAHGRRHSLSLLVMHFMKGHGQGQLLFFIDCSTFYNQVLAFTKKLGLR